MTQITTILRLLRRGEGLTPLRALGEVGCLRLAARIADLRAQGHAIRTVMVSRHGKRLAEYRMSRHGA